MQKKKKNCYHYFYIRISIVNISFKQRDTCWTGQQITTKKEVKLKIWHNGSVDGEGSIK